MHEFSIALSIVDIAEKEVLKHKASAVERIELEIGNLSGIEPQALDFAWEIAVNDTVLAEAAKEIHYIKGKAICRDCGKDYDLENIYDACPFCNSYFKEFKSGKELRVKSLTLI